MDELKTLKEIATIEVCKSLENSKRKPDGMYPVIGAGVKPKAFSDEWNQEPFTITVASAAEGAGYVSFIATRFWADAGVFVVKPDETKVLKRYLYHFLKNNERKVNRLKIGAVFPKIPLEAFERVEVNLPSLEIQRRRVEILDGMERTTKECEGIIPQVIESHTVHIVYYRDTLLDSLEKKEDEP